MQFSGCSACRKAQGVGRWLGDGVMPELDPLEQIERRVTERLGSMVEQLMMRLPASRRLFAAALLAVIGACHGVTDPMSAGTTFVLDSVGAPFIPATGTNPAGWTLVADTLVFVTRDANGAGQFEHREVGMIGSVRSGPFLYAGSYEWRGGLLRLSWPVCPLDALCTDYRPIPAIGGFGSGTLSLTYLSAGLSSRRYRRVD